jgi:hypothetical protein
VSLGVLHAASGTIDLGTRRGTFALRATVTR